jgi:hypothetical protein
MENEENIVLPKEIRATLGPMIVQSITDKLNKAGVKVSQDVIQKYVDDESIQIEFPAVLFRNPKSDPRRVFIPKHVIVCIPVDPFKNGLEKQIGSTMILGT